MMDEEHLAHAVCYVSLNPVRAGLVERPQDWPWSSAKDHLQGRIANWLTLPLCLNVMEILLPFLVK
ncbi:MAG: hypothetical protein Q9M17_04030, partial [Mariprofundus sp.]|nr:hypothetical protein [Mariprofundus sp.]